LAKIILGKGESVDSALKRFKSKVYRDGTLAENKKREFYVKPGVARRLKENESKRNSKKNSSNSRYDD